MRISFLMASIFCISYNSSAMAQPAQVTCPHPVEVCTPEGCKKYCYDSYILRDINGNFTLQLNNIPSDALPKVLEQLKIDQNKISIPN